MTKKQNRSVVTEHKIEIEQIPGESPEKAIARGALRPSAHGAFTLLHWNAMKLPLDMPALVRALAEQSKLASAGDLSRGEAMLMSQAHTLDAIFNQLAQIAKLNLFKNVEAADTLLRLALRAQAQCRAAVETLAEIKNPKPVAFVRQANIAHGPQQVNNGRPTEPARAEKTENLQSKLLENDYGDRLDSGATSSAIAGNPGLEAVEAVNRAEDPGGEGKSGT